MTAPSDASRREVLKTVAAGATGLAVAVAVPRSGAIAPTAPQTKHEPKRAEGEPSRATPDPFLSDLVGRRLDGYRVESVGAVERGGIAVVLATACQTFRVDVLRVDPSDSSSGIGVQGAVAVYLRNGGDGSTATNEEQGLGAMALARELLRRERAEGRTPPPSLLTRGERDALDAHRVA